MKYTFAKIRGMGFILWQSRHMAYHVMLGLLWAWFLRELWHEFNPVWIWTSALGTLLPDIDHFYYWFGYGRHETYPQQVFTHMRKREWRKLFYFISTGHKTNTSLSFHNVYVTGLFVVISWLASLKDWRLGVVLFGAIVSHYIFDMADDLAQLGELNANWKRWGRPR